MSLSLPAILVDSFGGKKVRLVVECSGCSMAINGWNQLLKSIQGRVELPLERILSQLVDGGSSCLADLKLI